MIIVAWYTKSLKSIIPRKNSKVHACINNNPRNTICGKKLNEWWFLETNPAYLKSVNCKECLKLMEHFHE